MKNHGWLYFMILTKVIFNSPHNESWMVIFYDPHKEHSPKNMDGYTLQYPQRMNGYILGTTQGILLLQLQLYILVIY